MFAISFPSRYEPFGSLPRFILVLFPLFMWLACWAGTRRRAIAVAGVFVLGLAAFTALFATWRFVA